MVQLGEVSAGRQALEAADLVPGSPETLAALTDPARRPAVLRDALPARVVEYQPPESFQLDAANFVENVRTAWKGAAPGPSGWTSEQLRLLLDIESDTELLTDLASQLAAADVPAEVVAGLGLGRLTALSKPEGGVRGIVAGDLFRRLVARTISQ